jgi:hypothetical protein
MIECGVFRMKAAIGSAVFLALLVTTTTGYSTFQMIIPNGPNVPNPCQPGTVWSGVGHRAPGGGGDRNPFGRAFDANQYVSLFTLNTECKPYLAINILNVESRSLMCFTTANKCFFIVSIS